MIKYQDKETGEIKDRQAIASELIAMQQCCSEFDDYDVVDVIEEYYSEIEESEVEQLSCEKCGISSREVSLISEADICYQCEKEEGEVE